MMQSCLWELQGYIYNLTPWALSDLIKKKLYRIGFTEISFKYPNLIFGKLQYWYAYSFSKYLYLTIWLFINEHEQKQRYYISVLKRFLRFDMRWFS